MILFEDNGSRQRTEVLQIYKQKMRIPRKYYIQRHHKPIVIISPNANFSI